MIERIHRDLRKADGVQPLADLIQSLLASELICPSRRLWLVSPWVSDVPIIDNSAGQFSSLVPEWDRAPVRLLQVLISLAERGTEVIVALRDQKHNVPFCDRLDGARAQLGDRIRRFQAEHLHEKGLLGDRFYLCGSFNFTFNGIFQSEEVAHLFVDEASIAENAHALTKRWLGG